MIKEEELYEFIVYLYYINTSYSKPIFNCINLNEENIKTLKRIDPFINEKVNKPYKNKYEVKFKTKKKRDSKIL